MINIAICDDNTVDLDFISYLFQEYAASRSDLELDISTFTSAFKMMDYIENPLTRKKFDIYLLDVLMPSIMGTDVASSIRKIDEDGHIIFITSSPEFALESYDVFASGYIVKPIVRQKFYNTLDRIIPQVTEHMERSDRISVKTKDGLKYIKLHMIRYIEYRNHVVEFHMFDENVISSATSSITLSGLYENLKNERRFVMPHRAFIVNLAFVSALENQAFIMDRSEKIPISRNIVKSIKQKYIDFTQQK